MKDMENEIALYLSGEMSPEEKTDFEQKINENPQLQDDIRIYMEMNQIFDNSSWELIKKNTTHPRVAQYEGFLKSKKGQSITDTIKTTQTRYFDQQSASPKSGKLYYYYAAAAVIVIMLFAYLYQQTPASGVELYAQYKALDEMPSLTQRANETEVAEAAQLFRKGNYQEALNVFNGDFRNDNLYSQILIYRGFSQLELGEHQDAIKTFEELLNSNSLDSFKAQWYLALSYLKIGNKEKSRAVLKIVVENPKNYKYREATKLLELLD